VIQARIRGYDSALDAALSPDGLPTDIYETLVSQTRENLPTLHRYLKLRARMLGVDDLGYHDLYPPLVSRDETYDLNRSKEITLAACAPLGPDYTKPMAEAFEAGWMDVYPRAGKRSGAYMSSSAYDVHPYVLLNHNDDYESASTFAHEWGHAMHSHLANEAQEYPTADYATFTAEIASTFNEALLLDYMLKQAKDDDERLFYLGSALENLRGTYFRQAMFAEFELSMHKKVEAGEGLTGKVLSEMYLALVRDYHGHDQGITEVDESIALEWAYIPHFYYNFYVWQYATSLAASAKLSEPVLNGEDGSVETYLTLLRSGGSDEPHTLLLEAGVDLSSPDPYNALARRMDAIMDDIEAILDQKVTP
jgi:oligoendopeptidase F